MRSKSLNDYQIIIVSDISDRNGIGIEVYLDDELLIEIFRDDEYEKCSVTLFEKDLPLELVEDSIRYFKEEIPRDFDK